MPEINSSVSDFQNLNQHWLLSLVEPDFLAVVFTDIPTGVHIAESEILHSYLHRYMEAYMLILHHPPHIFTQIKRNFKILLESSAALTFVSGYF